MSDIKFIQFEVFPDQSGRPILFALDNAGTIWRLGNQFVHYVDENGRRAGESRETWFAMLGHPASSAKHDG